MINIEILYFRNFRNLKIFDYLNMLPPNFIKISNRQKKSSIVNYCKLPSVKRESVKSITMRIIN